MICRGLKFLPGGGDTQIAVDGIEAGNDAGDVAIEDRDTFSVSDAKDGGCGVIADARKGEHVGGIGRELAVMLGDNLPGRFLEIASTRIVTKASSEAENFLGGSFGEGLDGWKMFEETVVVWDGGSDASLLQHNFGEPDSVGISGAAPWEVSLELVKPGEKVFAETR